MKEQEGEISQKIESLSGKIIDDWDKIGELVKQEISARFSSDVKLKNLAGQIFEGLNQDL